MDDTKESTREKHHKINTLKLKSRIIELGYTQEEIAKSMDLDTSTFSLKINNKRRIYIDEVITLCKLLEINKPIQLREYFGLDFLFISNSRENATIDNGGNA